MTASTRRTKNFIYPISTMGSPPASGFWRQLEPAEILSETTSVGRSNRYRRPREPRRATIVAMIIDCHCHAGKGDLMTAPWNTDAPIEPYLRRARAAGIDKTIIFAPFHSDYAEANEQLARIVARYPDRLIGFAFVHASRDTGRIHSMVQRAFTRWHFRGIKV